MSDCFRADLGAQFYSGAYADVRIRFHLERTPEQQWQEQNDRRDAEGATGDVVTDVRFVGEPLPAHKVILTLGSSLLQAKLSNLCWQGRAASGVSIATQTEDLGSNRDDVNPAKRIKTSHSPSTPAKCARPSDDGCSPPGSALPEVLVPLNSEAEVPFARQAIEFIYTGCLSTDLGFEALLRVRQQACYLGVKHCPQACDQAMLAWLQAGEGEEQQQGQQQQGAGTSAGSPAAAHPRALQAYACHVLFPEPGTSPDAASFQPVRSALAKQLVSHFGDAVAALTRPDLYRQLLQLPAVAVRELLAADDFGTDSEDSVFLLLAAWLEANRGQEGREESVPAATRAELCGLVRLHRLMDTYLHHVLPVYEPFDVSRAELGFLLRYARAADEGKAQVLAVDSKRQGSPWYCSLARRQVVPEEGRSVEWSISREQLEQGLREMVQGKEKAWVRAASCTPPPAMADNLPGMRVLSCGMLWSISLLLDPATIPLAAAAGAAAAGLYLFCYVPRQLGSLSGLADTSVRFAVHRWAQGERVVGFSGTFGASGRRFGEGAGQSAHQTVIFGRGRGWAQALKLQPAAAAAAAAAAASSASVVGGGGSLSGTQQAGAQRQEAEGAGGVEAELAAQLARWSEWLHEGKITGTVTFCKP